MKNLKITNEIIIYTLVTILIFYGFISKIINPAIKYIDELIVIYLFLYFIYLLYKGNKIPINDNDKKIIKLLTIFYTIGLLGNIISGYQKSIIHILIDLFAFMKLPFSYFFATKIFQMKYKELDKQKYNLIIKFCKIITIIIAIIVIVNVLFSLDLGKGYSRFGLPSYSLGGHPTFAAAICCCLASIFMVEHKQNSKWILMNLLLCAATLKLPG